MKRRDFVKQTAAAGAALAIHPAFSHTASQRLPFSSSHVDFNPGWRFLLGDAAGAEGRSFDDHTWNAATLPHTGRIEALVTGAPGSDTYQWQGICWYRKRFSLGPEVAGRIVFLKFDGAMNEIGRAHV